MVCCICRYVGALTGIFSFVLFLPFLFKENYGIQEKCPTKELTNVENSVNYLRSCSNVLDMNFGETNNDATNATDVSVSSLETASSGFGSGDVKHENVSSPGESMDFSELCSPAISEFDIVKIAQVNF